MRSPAVSLLLVCGKCPKTTEHSGLSQATCIFISPSPSVPTVPSCSSPCAVLPVFLSYLPPSLVHSHRPFHRQSLPDLQQTDSVSRSATYLFSVTSNRLSTLTFFHSGASTQHPGCRHHVHNQTVNLSNRKSRYAVFQRAPQALQGQFPHLRFLQRIQWNSPYRQIVVYPEFHQWNFNTIFVRQAQRVVVQLGSNESVWRGKPSASTAATFCWTSVESK